MTAGVGGVIELHSQLGAGSRGELILPVEESAQAEVGFFQRLAPAAPTQESELEDAGEIAFL